MVLVPILLSSEDICSNNVLHTLTHSSTGVDPEMNQPLNRSKSNQQATFMEVFGCDSVQQLTFVSGRIRLEFMNRKHNRSLISEIQPITGSTNGRFIRTCYCIKSIYMQYGFRIFAQGAANSQSSL